MPSISPSRQLILCHCLQVSEAEVRDAIVIGGCCTLAEIRRCTGAGAGCTACHHRIAAVLREESFPAASAGSQAEGDFAGAERHPAEPSPI